MPVRLDGLYFDRQTDPITLLVPSSTMRVGISAQGYLLPAPTGIVDYQLARAGEVVEGLNVVLGTVLMEPRVSGEEVANGTIGKVPVGQTERLTIGSAEYQLPRLPSFSVSATVTSVDDRMASSDNQLSVPARSVLDLGARYRFHISGAPATLRLSFGNVFDKFGWRTGSSEVFVTNAPRRISITLAADFPGAKR
jgi:iron complex outermembrane receptor protein